jgi:hypothetical protein
MAADATADRELLYALLKSRVREEAVKSCYNENDITLVIDHVLEERGLGRELSRAVVAARGAEPADSRYVVERPTQSPDRSERIRDVRARPRLSDNVFTRRS